MSNIKVAHVGGLKDNACNIQNDSSSQKWEIVAYTEKVAFSEELNHMWF